MESLTGPQAVKKAMNMTLDNDPVPPTPTIVHFKVIPPFADHHFVYGSARITRYAAAPSGGFFQGHWTVFEFCLRS